MPKTKSKLKKEEPLLGEKVKFYRQRLDISQLELEHRAGLSLGMVSRMENNLVTPSLDTLWKIAAALNLNSKEIAYLFKVNLYKEKTKL